MKLIIKPILAFLLSIPFLFGCKKEANSFEIKLHVDSSNSFIGPQKKDELMAFIENDVDKRIVDELLSLKPWDVLFSNYKLESLLSMLYYRGFPDGLLGLIDYPFISDRALNPYRVFCVYIYSELKKVPIDEFHVLVIKDERFDKKRGFEEALQKVLPWWNDSSQLKEFHEN